MSRSISGSTSTDADVCGGCKASQKDNGGILDRCSRCKVQKCFSKERQKKDWALHKKICKTMRDLSTFGPRQVIMFPHKRPLHEAVPLSSAYIITPKPGPPSFEGYGCEFRQTTLDKDSMKEDDFIDLPITKAIGSPLRMTKSAIGDPNIPNRYRGYFSLESDPSSATFGQPMSASMAFGVVIIARPDFEPFNPVVVKSITEYCSLFQEFVEKTMSYSQASGELILELKRKIAKSWLSPEAFKVFFDRAQKQESAVDPGAWSDVQFPLGEES